MAQPLIAAKSSVLGGGGEARAEHHAAEFRVDQDRAIAVVPGEAQQSRFTGSIIFQAAREFETFVLQRFAIAPNRSPWPKGPLRRRCDPDRWTR